MPPSIIFQAESRFQLIKLISACNSRFVGISASAGAAASIRMSSGVYILSMTFSSLSLSLSAYICISATSRPGSCFLAVWLRGHLDTFHESYLHFPRILLDKIAYYLAAISRVNLLLPRAVTYLVTLRTQFPLSAHIFRPYLYDVSDIRDCVYNIHLVSMGFTMEQDRLVGDLMENFNFRLPDGIMKRVKR